MPLVCLRGTLRPSEWEWLVVQVPQPWHVRWRVLFLVCSISFEFGSALYNQVKRWYFQTNQSIVFSYHFGGFMNLPSRLQTSTFQCVKQQVRCFICSRVCVCVCLTHRAPGLQIVRWFSGNMGPKSFILSPSWSQTGEGEDRGRRRNVRRWKEVASTAFRGLHHWEKAHSHPGGSYVHIFSQVQSDWLHSNLFSCGTCVPRPGGQSPISEVSSSKT